MNYMDIGVLERVLSQAGLVIEFSGLFQRANFPYEAQLDGRESVGIIARKL
jgi:hypothetical protein